MTAGDLNLLQIQMPEAIFLETIVSNANGHKMLVGVFKENIMFRKIGIGCLLVFGAAGVSLGGAGIANANCNNCNKNHCIFRVDLGFCAGYCDGGYCPHNCGCKDYTGQYGTCVCAT